MDKITDRTKNTRINWIDWTKTIGIFSVIVGHMYFSEDVSLLKKIIYSFHMPFFFLISGYLDKLATNPIKKNLKHLILPYLWYNFITLFVFYIPRIYKGSSNWIEVGELTMNIFLGNPLVIIGSCWFLIALFWSKIFAYYLLKLPILSTIIMSFLMGYLGYFLYHHLETHLPYQICQGLLATPFIIGGYYLKKYNIIDLIYNNKLILFTICLICILPYSILVKELDQFDFLICGLTNKPFLGIIMCLTGCLLFLLFCRALNYFSLKFVSVISSGTILILVIHHKIYLLFLEKHYSYMTNFVISLSVCCFIMVLCYYLILLLKKNKLSSLLFLGYTPKK